MQVKQRILHSDHHKMSAMNLNRNVDSLVNQ